MTDIVLEWPLSNNDHPKVVKRRAGVVCTACHARKQRCNLQVRWNQSFPDCSSCAKSGRECREQPSLRRGKRRHTVASRSPGGSAEGTAAQEASEALPTATPSADDRVFPAKEINIPESHMGDVDTGFIHLYRPEHIRDAELQAKRASKSPDKPTSSFSPHLLQIFADTYFEYCYPWCPVLDRSTLFAEVARSPLLANALALASSHVKPPITPHDGPASYYDRARRMFYEDQEPDAILALKSLLLFYWWAPRSTSMVHRHSSWWWTSIVIRHAQQMDMHRELRIDRSLEANVSRGIRRRIWWTAFARERLTALCQSKPPIIDPEDCSIGKPTLDDFPDRGADTTKAEIFIYWVRLCAILGKMAACLSRTSQNSQANVSPPYHLGNELIAWVRSLPPHLTLPIASNHTPNFNRDVHQLHLPYLVAVIVLHLRSSNQALPKASPPAILAASCVARIFEDILSRGDTRYLMAITSWYSAVPFVTLLQASYYENLSPAANAELDIITLTTNQLRKMWASSNVVYEGFMRLRSQQTNGTLTNNQSTDLNTLLTSTSPANQGTNAGSLYIDESGGINWLDYFPFATRHTSKVANELLAMDFTQWHTGYDWQTDCDILNFQDWFDPFSEDFIDLQVGNVF